MIRRWQRLEPIGMAMAVVLAFVVMLVVIRGIVGYLCTHGLLGN